MIHSLLASHFFSQSILSMVSSQIGKRAMASSGLLSDGHILYSVVGLHSRSVSENSKIKPPQRRKKNRMHNPHQLVNLSIIIMRQYVIELIHAGFFKRLGELAEVKVV